MYCELDIQLGIACNRFTEDSVIAMRHIEALLCIRRPYGFLDRYDPGYVCNHSDDSGRYDYQSQPSICRWNCLKLAEAIQGALPLSKAKQELEIFDQEFDRWIAPSA